MNPKPPDLQSDVLTTQPQTTILVFKYHFMKFIALQEKVVSRLSGLVEMSKGVAELEKFNQSEAGSSVLFQTWDVDKFCKAFSISPMII